MSDEHVIPQVLGGWFTIPFVCVHCNTQRFGAQFEAVLKKNGFVVAAIDKLGLQARALAYKKARLTLNVNGGQPLIAYFDKSNAARHFPQEIDDGSLIIPEDEAKTVLRKQIVRFERDRGRKAKFDMDSYDALPYGIVIPIDGTNISFIKHRNKMGSLTISGLDQPIPLIVPAKIAFEHLAGLFYPYVLRAEFNPIREWLHQGDSYVNNHVLLTTYLRDKPPDKLNYQPFHFVRLGYQHESLSAIVSLFGTIHFSVFLAHIPDFSSFPFLELIGTYHFYDIKNCFAYIESVPEKFQKQDEMHLLAVSEFGRAQTRKA